MRRAAQVDANHAEIVDAFRKMGATVLDLSRVGGGCPDLLVGRRGENLLVEVKTARGKLRETQQKFFSEWRGQCCVVRSVADVLVIMRGV